MSPLNRFLWGQLIGSTARTAEDLAIVSGYPLEAVLLALANFARRGLIKVGDSGYIELI